MDISNSDVSISPKILEHGTYYVGYEAWYCGKQYVAKSEDLKNRISKKLLKRERKFLVHLKNPYIVQQLVMLDDQKSPLLLMEKMYMNLTEFLTTNQSNYDKINILHDTACGLHYIHEKGIVHCNLTADNILITKNIRAKLADFGRATFCQHNIKHMPETSDHLPPEVFEPYSKVKYSTKVDMFSFGCVVIHTFTQEYPTPDFDKYVETSEVGKYKKHSEVERRSVCIKKFTTSNSIRLHNITLKCLHDHPDYRPTAATVCSLLEKQLARGVPNSGKSAVLFI